MTQWIITDPKGKDLTCEVTLKEGKVTKPEIFDDGFPDGEPDTVDEAGNVLPTVVERHVDELSRRAKAKYTFREAD